MIKYNVKTVNDWLYNSNPIKKLYYNGMVRYRRFVANGEPTPPTPSFDGKWKATYSNGNVTSAECGSSSAIVRYEINLSDLVSVEIGDCVTSIGYSAFINCSSLTSVTIPSSVTSLDNNAFTSCSGLTSVTIPSGVTYIGVAEFQNCTSLTSITILATTPPNTPHYSVFSDTNNCPIYVPDASVNAYKAAFVWNMYASRIKPLSEKTQ